MSGLPIASPVIITELARSVSTSRHTSWGSNFGTRMVRLPTKLWPMTDHWVAPCMSGAMGNRVTGPARPFSTISSGRWIRVLLDGSSPPPRA